MRQPIDEHQQNNTKFAQVAHTICVLRKGQGVWANGDSYCQITQHGGKLEIPARRHTQQGRKELVKGNAPVLARAVALYKMLA